jgi:hypothetical protein
VSRIVKYVVVPFHMVKRQFVQSELRFAESEARAVEMAATLANRFSGVAAVEVYFEQDTGEMSDPRELAVFGCLPDDRDEYYAA